MTSGTTSASRSLLMVSVDALIGSSSLLPLGRSRVPLGVLVGILEDLPLWDVRVHTGGPGVVAERAGGVLDGLLDRLAGPAEIDADELALVLHDAAVDEDGVDVGALRLEGDVAVGVQHREHDRRVVVLDEHDVGLLARLEAADQRVEAERLAAAAGRPVDDLLGAQVVVRDRLLL